MFELAASAAALLSPVSVETVEHMRCYGYSIGMAFQIIDDILDFTGEQATVGKPVASDLRQGLITLPALLYYDQAPQDPDFQLVLQGDHLPEAAVNRLVTAIRDSGAIQASASEANRYIRQGLEVLGIFPAGPERLALEDLARYITNRDF